MGFGYAVLAGFMGEIVEENGDGRVWEVRPEIKRYTIADPSRSSLQTHDQPPLHEIACYFEEFWTSGEPIPAGMGLRVGRREEVLKVTLEGVVFSELSQGQRAGAIEGLPCSFDQLHV